MWRAYDRRSVRPWRPEPDPNDIGMRFSFNIVASITDETTNAEIPVAASDGFDPQGGVWQGDLNDLSAPNPMFDKFQITIDQLEGEINLPYNLIRKITILPAVEETTITIMGNTSTIPGQPERPYVEQKIEVPRSPLGGFAQFRINYQYIHYQDGIDAEGGDGQVVTGEIITPRVLVPRKVFVPPPPPPPALIIDEGQIKEALADKIYEKFFNSELIQGNLDDLKSFQSTQSPDGIGYQRGRESDDDQLIFFKKDRNTPENQADFNGDGRNGIQAIANDIRASLESIDASGLVDLSDKLDNEISIQEIPASVRIPSTEPPPGATQEETDSYEPLFIEGTETALYYVENIAYKLIYTSDFSGEIIEVEFASFNRFFENNEGEQRYQEGGQDKPDQWLNKLNLSQLTKPKSGTKVNINRARNLLDTNIFELLPNQAERQNEINQFFQKFQALIGNKPSFEDVDGDGAGEAIQDLQIEERISTAPQEKKETSYITRLNQEADTVNQNKTLQSMRDTLNEYLGDVDNVVEDFEELPEYENKSEGFLKIRKHNQSIIIRNNTNIMPLLETKTITRAIDTIYQDNPQGPNYPPIEINSVQYTGPSWQVEGFTITMWVRFTNSTTNGSLMTYGNPMLKQKGGFRLDTHTRSDDNPSNGFTTNRRMVRLVVYEKVISGGAIYDSHYGRDFDPNPDGRGVKYQTWQDGGNPAYEEFAAMENGSWHVFMQHTEIPTTDLNEWFFICATYDPFIDEEGSFDDVNLFRDTDFWLNKKQYNGNIVANSGFGNKCKVEVISRRDLLTARGFRV